ncbi:MAG: Tex-like N-terminal domain-containing protein [Thiotrichaceae bacterium]
MPGATVPFIARYRKEATEGLDDTQLRNLEEQLTLPKRVRRTARHDFKKYIEEQKENSLLN